LQIYKPIYAHIDNNHPPLGKEQSEDLSKFSERMSDFFNLCLDVVKSNNYGLFEDVVASKDDLISHVNNMKRNQIKYLKKLSGSTKVTMLFLEIMTESKNLVIYTTNALEAQKDFFHHMEKWKKPHTKTN